MRQATSVIRFVSCEELIVFHSREDVVRRMRAAQRDGILCELRVAYADEGAKVEKISVNPIAVMMVL